MHKYLHAYLEFFQTKQDAETEEESFLHEQRHKANTSSCHSKWQCVASTYKPGQKVRTEKWVESEGSEM